MLNVSDIVAALCVPLQVLAWRVRDVITLTCASYVCSVAHSWSRLQDHFFQPILSDMVKLVFLSSGVHQVIFSAKSTLPYAVGQVQDVGLIFLSAMATSVVEACKKAGQEREVIQGTVLVTLLLTTLLVGLLIILTGM